MVPAPRGMACFASPTQAQLAPRTRASAAPALAAAARLPPRAACHSRSYHQGVRAVSPACDTVPRLSRLPSRRSRRSGPTVPSAIPAAAGATDALVVSMACAHDGAAALASAASSIPPST
eukprot:363857-Chlamydomonas_euryale.AAC.7